MKILGLSLLMLLFCILFSCNKDENRIEGKWQLRYQETKDGSIIAVDTIFYNFQKGTFSAICLEKENNYQTFFGNYTLLSDKISIILLDNYENEIYQKYLNWTDIKRVYTIEILNEKTLELNCDGIISVFRKY